MKKLLSIAGILVLAAGCATVGQVKDLETRVDQLEKKVSTVEGKVESFDEKIGNFKSRITTLEENYKVIYDEVNTNSKDKGNNKPVKKVKSTK